MRLKKMLPLGIAIVVYTTKYHALVRTTNYEKSDRYVLKTDIRKVSNYYSLTRIASARKNVINSMAEDRGDKIAKKGVKVIKTGPMAYVYQCMRCKKQWTIKVGHFDIIEDSNFCPNCGMEILR